METILKANKQILLNANKRITLDIFPDGEAVLYDDEKEVTHILNKTALIAYKACVGHTYQQAENIFIEKISMWEEDDDEEEDNGEEEDNDELEECVSREELVKDFKCIVNDFLEKEILKE